MGKSAILKDIKKRAEIFEISALFFLLNELKFVSQSLNYFSFSNFVLIIFSYRSNHNFAVATIIRFCLLPFKKRNFC